MMRRSLHRIAPTLLALGLLPASAWSAVGPAERDAHLAAVQTLIEREFRLPAQRQLADFQKAAYPDAVWYGKYLAWFYADRFRTLTPDKAEAAKLAAEAKTLEAELKTAGKQLPKLIYDAINGSGVVIRLVNDLLRVVGQDQAPDRLGAAAVVAERRASLNATTLALIAATTSSFNDGVATVKAHAKAEEDAMGKDEKDPVFLKVAQEAVELRLEVVRPTYFALKALREVSMRGQDFGIDPAPATAFIKEFATNNFAMLQDWDYNWGDYQPYLRAFAVDLAAQAARFKIKGANAEDMASDLRKIVDLDLSPYRDPAVAEEIRTLQAKSWGSLLEWYREMGRDIAPKWYQSGLDVFQEFKDKTKNDRHFKLDHPNRERATEVARIYFQAARLQAAKKDPAAAGIMNLVAAMRTNPLAGNAVAWVGVINGTDGASVPGASAWGAQPVAADPAASVMTGNAMLRQANASGDPAIQRSALLTAAVALRNGVLGLSSTAFAEGADEAAPELWFRYAESLNKLGMRWHAALVAQSGLRHIATRTTELKGKTPWKDKDGKWTLSGKFISPLARNSVTYASNLLAAGKGPAVTQIYDESITLVNTVSPADGGKALDRIQVIIAIQEGDYKRALELTDSYVKKYPDEFFDAASLRSFVYTSWLNKLKNSPESKPIADKAMKESEEVAKLAAKELLTATDPARKRVLNQAMRDGQGLSAVIALSNGNEEKVLDMLGADYWKSAPSDPDKAAEMLGYLCKALRQWYETQVKDPAKGVDAKLLVASWPRVQGVYEIWKTQKARLTSLEERVTRQGVQIAWVFNVISTRQIPAMRSQPGAPEQLAEIGPAASRAFADLTFPTLTATGKPDNLLGVGNVLWELGDHLRASQLFEWYLNGLTGDTDLAALRNTPKDILQPLDGPIRARPELRAKWEELVDLLYDDPELSKKIIEQDLPETDWREKKRDYVRASEALRALRTELAKAKMALGPAFQGLDDGLVKLDGQISQLAREIAVTARLALAYREQGDKPRANALYEKLIAYDPTNPDFLAAAVELTLDALKDGKTQVAAELVEKTRIKAARVRTAAQDGSPTYWTAAIQVLELSLYMKDVKPVNDRLKFDAINQSTPADDLQLRPRMQRDDKRVRRAANSLSTELCKRYLAIFSQPGVTVKPSFVITEVAIDGKPTTLFVPPESPKFAAVRRELDDGSAVFILWEEGKEPPPEPEAPPAAPTPGAAAPNAAAPAAAPAPAPAPAAQPEAKP